MKTQEGPEPQGRLTCVFGKIQPCPGLLSGYVCPHKPESSYDAGRAGGEPEAAPGEASHRGLLCRGALRWGEAGNALETAGRHPRGGGACGALPGMAGSAQSTPSDPQKEVPGTEAPGLWLESCGLGGISGESLE